MHYRLESVAVQASDVEPRAARAARDDEPFGARVGRPRPAVLPRPEADVAFMLEPARGRGIPGVDPIELGAERPVSLYGMMSTA
jgi:hypothetical protein